MIAPASWSMDNHQLEELLREHCEELNGQLGYWQCRFDRRDVLVVTDETHNRMRIMTPIVSEDAIDQDEMRILLAANFDRALDAKFALSHGQLWSVFVHPLAELAAQMVPDVLAQVTTLANNYGGSYSSTGLTFGGGQ